MKLENFCCIGANFQNRQNDGKKQPQLFLYRSLDTNETIENMLSDGFFNTISDRVKENDLILLFHPEQENPIEIVYCKVTRSDGNVVTIKKVSNVALDILVDSADSVLLPESIDAENLRDYLIALETHLNSNVVHNWEGADESVDGEKTWNDDAYFEKNISATGNLTVDGTTDIAGATTIGDKLTTVGDIILENEENERHIKFKKSNDDTIRGEITNRYIPNSLVTLNFSSFYNTEKKATINMIAGENIKSNIYVDAELNDAATGETDIHRRTVATQGWVNNPEKSLNVVHRSGDEEISGRKDFLDDITAPNQLDYTNVSNCIAEIPQDIKLELNNGVLTLKAGSKIYAPNGFESDGVTRKFDVITIESDKTWTNSDNRSFILSININTQNIWGNWTENTISGNVEPPNDFFGFFYNTDSNLIYDYRGSTGRNFQSSFPICIVTSNTTQITSINQIFNGFGYIGSTIFALPGVKGLIPDGRNADGSLKNIELTYNHVITKTFTGTADNTVLIFRENSIGEGNRVTYHESINYNEYGYTETDTRFCIMGSMTITEGVISNFERKTPFHAVDYNDTEFIASQVASSDRYIDLTLAASGNSYTAQATGWIMFSKIATDTQQYIELGISNSIRYRGTPVSASSICLTSLYVEKGQKFYVIYTADGNTNFFRFIYAKGSK